MFPAWPCRHYQRRRERTFQRPDPVRSEYCSCTGMLLMQCTLSRRQLFDIHSSPKPIGELSISTSHRTSLSTSNNTEHTDVTDDGRHGSSASQSWNASVTPDRVSRLSTIRRSAALSRSYDAHSAASNKCGRQSGMHACCMLTCSTALPGSRGDKTARKGARKGEEDSPARPEDGGRSQHPAMLWVDWA